MFVEIVRHTPIWVFFLFAALLGIGALQLRDRQVSMGRMLALPVAAAVMGFMGVITAFGAHAGPIGASSAACC